MSNRLASCSAVVLLALASVGNAASDARLVQAARDRDAASVRALLAEGADVNATQPDGTTALHWAAHWDDLDTADLLIRRDANVNAMNELGATPLWVSCVHGGAPMIERLLQAGADVNAALPSGETPLMTAARTGIVEAVRALLNHGADVDAIEFSRGQTALMWAVAQRHTDVAGLLIQHGADVRARSSIRRVIVNTGTAGGDAEFEGSMVVPEDRGGYTALLFAARHGDVASARLLLDAGADANDTAPTGTSALVVAAHGGHAALATFLLEQGADPNAADAGYTALHAAVLRGDDELLQALLAHGADPNTRLARATPFRRLGRDWAMDWTWVGATPFWMAAMFADAAMMQALAAGGAVPGATREDGTTSRHGAARHAGSQTRDPNRAQSGDRHTGSRPGGGGAGRRPPCATDDSGQHGPALRSRKCVRLGGEVPRESGRGAGLEERRGPDAAGDDRDAQAPRESGPRAHGGAAAAAWCAGVGRLDHA